MSINENKLPEYHFFATEIDYKINTKAKKILAGNWCHKHSSLKNGSNENIEILKGPWENSDLKQKDYIFIQNILTEYCEKLTLYLNKYNNENFTIEFWKVLILPWLVWYFTAQLHKWRIINKVLDEKKTLSFFSFSDHAGAKHPIDTYAYNNLLKNDHEFNYFQFKAILKYLRNKGNKILFIEELYEKKKVSEVKVNSFFNKIKFNILGLFDDITLFLSKKNNIYIESGTFRKKDYLKVNFQLRQFPTYFQKLFNYRLENKKLEKIKVNMEKRIAIPFSDITKSKENIDFIQYLNFSIRNDMPISFLEGFSDLKKDAQKINLNPKVILSSHQYFYGEKFKLWTGLKILENNSKLITTHGGIQYKKFSPSFNIVSRFAYKTVTWVTSRNENEIQLPATKFISFDRKRKYYKYLSYVGSYAHYYPGYFGSRQYSLESNLKDIEKFNVILNKKIFKNLIYLPFENWKWNYTNKIRNIIKKNYINEPLCFMKYLHKSRIVVCSYPGTPLYESMLTGPTILLYKFNSDLIDERFQKIFSELVKYKIAFSNAEDVSLHINKVWDNVDEWWNSDHVKNTISNFMQETCQTSDNSINIWVKFLKDEIKKNI